MKEMVISTNLSLSRFPCQLSLFVVNKTVNITLAGITQLTKSCQFQFPHSFIRRRPWSGLNRSHIKHNL